MPKPRFQDESRSGGSHHITGAYSITHLFYALNVRRLPGGSRGEARRDPGSEGRRIPQFELQRNLTAKLKKSTREHEKLKSVWNERNQWGAASTRSTVRGANGNLKIFTCDIKNFGPAGRANMRWLLIQGACGPPGVPPGLSPLDLPLDHPLWTCPWTPLSGSTPEAPPLGQLQERPLDPRGIWVLRNDTEMSSAFDADGKEAAQLCCQEAPRGAGSLRR